MTTTTTEHNQSHYLHVLDVHRLPMHADIMGKVKSEDHMFEQVLQL